MSFRMKSRAAYFFRVLGFFLRTSRGLRATNNVNLETSQEAR